MTKFERMYYDGGGCSCHTCAPCSFCVAMDETEVDLYWAGEMKELAAYWEKLAEDAAQLDLEQERRKELTNEGEWVTLFDYE